MRHPTRIAVALLALVLLLVGCSGADDGGADGAAVGADRGVSDAGGDPGGGEMDAGDEGAAPDPGLGSPGTGGMPAPAAGPGETPMMVRTVELDVLVADVQAAVARARATVVGANGWVSAEDVVPGTEDRPGYASLVLRVPSADLDRVVGGLGELGEVTGSRSQAADVTAEYRDVEARVATLEASAGRLRDLIGDATGVEAIAALERELADREADLDALKARIAVLENDVSRSTITLHLATESADLDRTRGAGGFGPGLRAGWDAFTSSVLVLLTALGAVLPFLVLVSLLAVPVLLWRRRRALAGGPAETPPTRTGDIESTP